MSRSSLFLYHTHTPDSNRFEREVRDLHIRSHAADYVEFTRQLPSGTDVVFVKTDHWKTDPTYFHRLQSRLTSTGAEMEWFETHVSFELAGSTGVVINGVEASLRTRHKHVIIAGLPIDDEDTYVDLSLDRLLTTGQRAGWIAPAHIGMPSHRFSEALLEQLFRTAAEKNIRTALGYTTGYFPLYNRLCRNEVPGRTSVQRYATRFQISLLPEIDLHATLPNKLAGCGLVDTATIEKCRQGRLPVDLLLDAALFTPDSEPIGITVVDFLRNYADLIPLFDKSLRHDQRFRQSIPETTRLQSLDFGTQTVSLR